MIIAEIFHNFLNESAHGTVLLSAIRSTLYYRYMVSEIFNNISYVNILIRVETRKFLVTYIRLYEYGHEQAKIRKKEMK